MKNEKSWLDWSTIEFDPNFDFQLEEDDCWQNHLVEDVRFPSDLLAVVV